MPWEVGKTSYCPHYTRSVHLPPASNFELPSNGYIPEFEHHKWQKDPSKPRCPVEMPNTQVVMLTPMHKVLSGWMQTSQIWPSPNTMLALILITCTVLLRSIIQYCHHLDPWLCFSIMTNFLSC